VHPRFRDGAVEHMPDAGLNIPVPSLVFSRDGKMACTVYKEYELKVGNAAVEANSIAVWEVSSGRILRRIETAPVSYMGFSPDGRYFVGASSAGLHLWEVRTGLEVLRRPAHERFRGYRGFASCVAFSPDGRSVATGLADSTVLVWDMLPPLPPGLDAKPDARAVNRLWSDLATGDGETAYAAIWALVKLEKSALPYLKERLAPTPAVDAQRVRQLIRDLESDRFVVRDTASRQLRSLGEEVEPFLQDALKNAKSAEMERRLSALLDTARDVGSAATRQGLRGVQVLEYVGTAEARDILVHLTKGPRENLVTREAVDSLARLTASRRK
jgi:WD domain, G-beta repeat